MQHNCFLIVVQEIMFPHNLDIKPETDFLFLLSLPQSESTYPNKLLTSLLCLYSKHTLTVPCKYLRTLLKWLNIISSSI